MKNIVSCVLGLGLITACAVTPIAQEPIAYRATRNLNENGTSSLVVRSVTSKDGYKELTGVPCELKGDGFTSKFTTPALVLTPNMGQRTPVASLTCNYNGQRFFQILQPINDTLTSIDANASAVGAGAGLIGVIVTGISSSNQRARRDATLDVFGYPDIAATFN